MALVTPDKASETKNISTPQDTNTAGVDAELDREYIDRRSITLSLVNNYSNYRKVNLKTLGVRKEVIGSSVRSCQVLSSNAAEVNAYFPALIGISPNNPEFIQRVKAWLSNIQFVVNETNVSLNTTFIYNHKRDYLAIQKQEDKINEEYDKVDRANTSAIRVALKRKIEALNTLESSKYQYGHPENLTEYLMYRHCLLYNDVAKDIALINGDDSIRFYIKDDAKEAEKARKLTEEKKKAMKQFIDITSTDSKFEAVFIGVVLAKKDNLSEAMLKDRTEKEAIMINYVNENPDKFNKLVADKNIKMKGFIETLIARGELVRSDYNQQISTADGQFIGSNMNEAVAWFDNPDNKDLRTAFENKLKLF